MLSAITFLAAFLLFQIELIVAKLFLPNYGGSYLVWGACVVFFQAVLLLGYVFAHKVIAVRGIGRYLKIHLFLLLLPFLFFPGRPIHVASGTSSLPLVVDIFLRLLTTIGPVFLILSTVSLVTQSWISSSKHKASVHPYQLYAVSNAGSFAALLTYPFVFEYFLTNTQQLAIWRGLYLLLVLLTFITFKLIPVTSAGSRGDVESKPAMIDHATMVRWFLLSAAGVVLFLSVTNIITYEVAPVPLLWIIPLGIYLLAFVLNFKQKPWCPSWVVSGIPAIIGLSVALYFITKISFFPPLTAIILINISLFLLCLYTQNALIRSKPAPGNLTFFYVIISLGGFAGGVLTSWVIPLVSNNLVEFLVGLFLVAAAVERARLKGRMPVLVLVATAAVVLLLVWSHFYRSYSLIGLLIIAVALGFAFLYVSRDRRIFLGLLGVVVMCSSPMESFWRNHQSLAKERNYYGIYDVYNTASGMRTIIHGTTLHGVQLLKEDMRMVPIGYYSPESPIGEILIKDIFQARRVGVVGLGAGTMAMYAKPSAPIDYYELDPDVVDLAKKYFWYIGLAPGPVNFIVGDARISLEKNKDAQYELLVIDAFGGDSIPIHLVNKDVVAKYRGHLADRGAVMFHITNRYLDLEPVLAHIADALGGFAAIKQAQNGGLSMHSDWALITWDQDRFIQLVGKEGWTPITAGKYKGIRVWTDDYSTILPILKFDTLMGEFGHFNFLRW